MADSLLTLADAYLRVERAAEHLDELRGLEAAYITEHGDKSMLRLEGMTLSAVWIPPPSPMLGVRAGEFAHNLRAALDYLAHRLAILDGGTETRTQFPISDTPAGFQQRRPKDLEGVNDAHAARIERLQPYNGGGWLRVLRDMTNIDKHRTLHVVGYQSKQQQAYISDKWTDEEARADGWFRRDEDPVAWYRPAPIALTFNDGTPLDDILPALLSETRAVLDDFAPDFEMAVYVHVRGDRDAAVPVFTELMNRALARGIQPAMRDPEAVAAGDGIVQFQFRAALSHKDAAAVLTAMIEEIPGALAILRIQPEGFEDSTRG
jgi:hypothetical protein